MEPPFGKWIPTCPSNHWKYQNFKVSNDSNVTFFPKVLVWFLSDLQVFGVTLLFLLCVLLYSGDWKKHALQNSWQKLKRQIFLPSWCPKKRTSEEDVERKARVTHHAGIITQHPQHCGPLLLLVGDMLSAWRAKSSPVFSDPTSIWSASCPRSVGTLNPTMSKKSHILKRRLHFPSDSPTHAWINQSHFRKNTPKCYFQALDFWCFSQPPLEGPGNDPTKSPSVNQTKPNTEANQITKTRKTTKKQTKEYLHSPAPSLW